MIIAIDPGTDKCGLAVVSKELEVATKEVLATARLTARIKELIAKYQINKVIVGDGTNSQEVIEKIKNITPEVITIDESHSTLEARDYYWKDNSPSGWKRLLPTSLQTPTKPIDDYVAVVLATRYLRGDS